MATPATERTARIRPLARRGALDEDAIYERIMAAVFEHRLPPGTKLGEDKLAGIFGVSRARIRRVLLRLAHEHVVTLEPNRGAFVAKPTAAEARDIFEARRLIEPGIVTQFIDRADRTGMTRLRQHVAKERRARAADDLRAIVRLSGEFHVLIAEIAGNAMLARTMRELTLLTCLIIALYDAPAVPHCRSDEHADIVEAIARKDQERAVGLMIEHLDHVRAGLDLDVESAEPADLDAILS
ncbi:MAG: GntR family transcriptional regulator [Acidobacteriota bacterium]